MAKLADAQVSGNDTLVKVSKTCCPPSEMTAPSKNQRSKLNSLRTWRNWQTRRFQVPMGDRAGSSPVVRTKAKNTPHRGVFCFGMMQTKTTGLEGGRRLREQTSWRMTQGKKYACQPTWTINNCPPGRAAKGASPVVRTNGAPCFRSLFSYHSRE